MMPSNTREYAKRWREEHREQSREYMRTYMAELKAQDPDYHMRQWYRRAYGLSLEKAVELLGQGCGICGGPATVIDHDHETKEVRGALCRTCNLGIGHLKDDPVLVEAALKYLLGGLRSAP